MIFRFSAYDVLFSMKTYDMTEAGSRKAVKKTMEGNHSTVVLYVVEKSKIPFW